MFFLNTVKYLTLRTYLITRVVESVYRSDGMYFHWGTKRTEHFAYAPLAYQYLLNKTFYVNHFYQIGSFHRLSETLRTLGTSNAYILMESRKNSSCLPFPDYII